MKRAVAAVLVPLLAAGCTVGPNYQRPEITTIPQQHRSIEGAAVQASLADLAWWDVFRDESLQALISEALAKNFDLRVAVQRVEEARALAGVARSAFYPSIGYGVAAGRGRTSENVQTVPDGQTQNLFDLSVGISWEIDLWGRIRRLNESARARLLASEEVRRGVVLSLVSEVATAYLELRELDMELDIARRTLESRKASLDLVSKRLLGGVANKLEYAQSASALAQTEAAIPEIERQIFQKENQISFLLGRPPGPIPRGTALEATPLPPSIPAGIPSALLERRPDVLQSEAALHAASAEIGVAKANYFPQLSLTGALGMQSTELGTLLESPSFVWNVGAGLFGPIFQGGQIRRRNEAAWARWEQAKAEYEKSATAAFGDVANSLDAYDKFGKVQQAQFRNVTELHDAERLALMRYNGGVSSYLEVLDAQRQLFQGEIQHSQAMLNHYLAVVSLYRALGGGWNTPETRDGTAAIPGAPPPPEARKGRSE